MAEDEACLVVEFRLGHQRRGGLEMDLETVTVHGQQVLAEMAGPPLPRPVDDQHVMAKAD